MIDTTSLLGSQMAVGYNVLIEQRDAKTFKLIKRIEGKNTVTKLPLMGIIRLFNGEFTEDSLIETESYVPKYLALGTNGRNQEGNVVEVITPENGGSSRLVTMYVDPNDSSLYRELDDTNNNYGDVSRIKLTQSNVIENGLHTDYVKLRIKCFVPSNRYNGSGTGTIIEEAGLFTEATGNNCWARYVMPTGTVIHKDENSVIDITWEITVKSASSAQYPTEIKCLLDEDISTHVPTLNMQLHYDGNNVIPQVIDLYSFFELYPIDHVNMNTLQFVVTGSSSIYSMTNRGIMTITGHGDLVVNAYTVNNMSATMNIHIEQ